MRLSPIQAVLCILFTLPLALATQEGSQGAVNEDEYERLTAQHNPNVARARAIFLRLVKAADNRPELPPRLLPVRGPLEPYVWAAPNGAIVLTEAGLELCYQGVSPETGDSRLALVLGHELAHLAEDDFRHRRAFARLDRDLTDSKSRELIIPSARQQVSKELDVELEADSLGLIYMLRAGYDADRLLAQQDEFFTSWVSRDTQGELPRKVMLARAEALRSKLGAIVDHLDYFYLANRFYQLGDHRQAIALYTVFSKEYSGPNLYNNLGLSHFQAAMQILSQCEARLVLRWKLPAVLNAETLASEARRRGPDSPCFDIAGFKDHKLSARMNFGKALQYRSQHRPASLNLASLLILAGDGTGALDAVKAILGSEKDAEAEAVDAVALYLWGKERRWVNTDQAALKIIRNLAARYPGSPTVAFNRARLEHEIHGLAEAQDDWKAYLRLEPTGSHADHAREQLGIANAAPDPQPATRRSPPKLALKVGKIDPMARAWLDDAEKPKKIRTNSLSAMLYRRGSLLALATDSRIVLVEQNLAQPLTHEEVISKYGKPQARISTTSYEFLKYCGFGFEMKGQKAQRLVLFPSNEP